MAPSKGRKRARRPATGAKKGPPEGHLGTSRHRVAPDWVVECRPTHCRGCGAPLPEADQEHIGTSQVVELPPVRAVVVEAHRYQATCARCGARTGAAYPAGLEPTRVFGPRLQALWTYLQQRHHVGYERLRGICGDLFGLDGLSDGAIANAVRRTARALEPQAAAIRETVRASPVIGSDETSARVNGQTYWQWVFQTPTASYHVIARRRNREVVQAFQGETRARVWGSDLWKPQLAARADRHQICLAHQLRDLPYAIDAEQSAWAQQCQALFKRAIHRAHQRDAGGLRGAAWAAAVAKLEADCDRLLATPLRGAEANRLQTRYRQLRACLFVFLHDPAVPPTNNASEQALRNSVVHRKVTGGFRSDWGADAHATVTTVLDTARKRGEDLLGSLLTALGPSPAHPGLLLSPPR